jgi:hypothetical protein
VFWFLSYRRSTPLAWALLVLMLVFTTLSPTDIFPHSLREGFFHEYKVKAIPMILAWGVIMTQLLLYPNWRLRLQESEEAEVAEEPEAATTPAVARL